MRLTVFSEKQNIRPMEPASRIIARLGGEAKVSSITGTAYTAPYRWQHPRERGGTGGFIPQKYHRVLLEYARANGIALELAEFVEAPAEAAE